MMITRRHLLQFAGATLATLGLSQLTIERQGLRYGQTLAQDTRRKLALLVGVNRYPRSQRFIDLRGCATDVEMQRQLLIHRFQFHPNDILVLSDEADLAPSRDNILTAFEEHLIAQAKPGDVVVFHFSGHGSRVLDPDPIHSDDLNSTFVPGDVAGDGSVVDDIMGRTLFLLMSALQTELVTVVLDSCYSGGGTRGNVRIRAAAGGRALRASDRELQYQDTWLSRLEGRGVIERSTVAQRRGLGVAKGVVIAAAQRDEPAADVTFSGFDAGAFTYLLTQFLWQQTDSVRSTVARIRADVHKLSSQLPLHEVQANSGFDTQPTYFIPEARQVPAAEAVIHADDRILWLGGVHPDAIATYNRGTTLVQPDSGQQLTIRDRQGLLAQIDGDCPLPANTVLREEARVVSGDVTLAIGIDPSLAPHLDQIQNYWQGLPYTTPVAPQADGTYGTEIHYILSRMTPAYRSTVAPQANQPAIAAIGLFSQDLSRWVPQSFAPPEESVRTTLINLTPRLRSLLAVHMVTLSLNAQASPLAITAQLFQADTNQVIAVARTGRAAPPADDVSTVSPSETVPTQKALQIQVTNHDFIPLHVGVLGIFPSGDFFMLLPPSENLDQNTVLPPGRTQVIPESRSNSDLIIQAPGLYKVVVLASPSPFNRALKSLEAVRSDDRLPEQTDPTEDLSGFNGLFEHLDSPRGEPQAAPTQTLATNQLVALSLPFEVI